MRRPTRLVSQKKTLFTCLCSIDVINQWLSQPFFGVRNVLDYDKLMEIVIEMHAIDKHDPSKFDDLYAEE